MARLCHLKVIAFNTFDVVASEGLQFLNQHGVEGDHGVSDTHDRHDLRMALLTIREAFPSAETAIFQTSDQDLYGFTLEEVIITNGCKLSEQDGAERFGQLFDAVWADICNIRWDGVMGEDYGGKATIDISSFLAATTELEEL